MPTPVAIIADPGLDTAFAIALALHDLRCHVVGLIASAGNVSAEQATQNVHVLIDQFDPPRWPRIGAAPPVQYDLDGTNLHGPGGLGSFEGPPVKLHSPTPGDKLLYELAREYPKQLTAIVLGPATVLALAMERYPDLAHILGRVVLVGGTWREPGNAGPVAEFHFACDPGAARFVLRSRVPVTVVPLDVTRQLILAPTELLELARADSKACRFLAEALPFGLRATMNTYGIEGFHLKDVVGYAALPMSRLYSVKTVSADVETRGELTRGMLVVDARKNPSERPWVDLAIDVDLPELREYVRQTLGLGDAP